jgi:hypothetical protein
VRLRYGNFRHRVSSVELAIERRPVLNARNVPVAVEEVWRCSGKLYNPGYTAAGMYQVLEEFEQAYRVNGRDLVLEHADGRPSYHQLISSECIGGTIVVQPPTFPTGKQGEYVSFRSYQLEVMGTKPLTARTQFLEFNERISIRGGGAKWGCVEVNFGPGVQQQLRTHSTCFATQSGSAVGYLALPQPPPPIWPFARTDEFPELELTSPKTIGEGFRAHRREYAISWSYNFEWPFRLTGTPHHLA